MSWRAFPVRNVILVFSALVCLDRPASALTVTDDFGSELRLDQPAKSVISLSPHLTELMYSIGAGDRLTGAARGSDYPAAAARLPEIGDSSGLDFERILSAHPDLVLAWGSGNRTVDIARLRLLGSARAGTGSAPSGRHSSPSAPAGRSDRTRRACARGCPGVRRAGRYVGQALCLTGGIRVLFEIWHRPLFTVNGDHILSKVLGLCAAQNIFAGLPRLAGEVSLEQALLLDPDAIVVGSEADDAAVNNWLVFSSLRAVRNGNVFAVSADQIARPTPRPHRRSRAYVP
jgi:iron complex transport system substrate-binding protein